MSLPIHIIQTKNRASRATVRDDTIVIRLAKGLTKSLEQEHIEILTRRILKAHAKHALRKRIEPLRDALLSNVDSLTIHPCIGDALSFVIIAGKKTKAIQKAGVWHVTRGSSMSEKGFERFLWKLVATYLEVECARYVRSINAHSLRVPIQSVSLKFMKSRWGSCSSTGNIALSTTLLFTTRDILEYVVIHELAHIVHMNHSKKFWKLVEKHCPWYKERVKELREFRVVVSG